MEKNWLIRTKSNHILGPVSKEKVQELYQNGSIKPDDEICSGNGYWFFIRETELVDKYLNGTTPQSFNPISEAKDILTAPAHSVAADEPPKDHMTMVGGIDFKKLQGDKSNPEIHHLSKLEKAPEIQIESTQKKKLKSENPAKSSDTTPKTKQQNWVKYLGIAIFIILFLTIYFRKSIMKSFFGDEAYYTPPHSLIFSDAIAQDESLNQKKNS